MIKYILCFVCGIVICFLFFIFQGNCNKIKTLTSASSTISIDTIHIDTIYIERDIQAVSFIGAGKLDATNSKIPIKSNITNNIIIIDSIDISNIDALDKYILPEFIVSLDTIVNRDTFSLRYEFPNNLFGFDFAPHKDSIMFRQIIIEHKITETKTNWFTTLSISTGAGIIGFLIGKSVKSNK
jgi:hypothetical protein